MDLLLDWALLYVLHEVFGRTNNRYHTLSDGFSSNLVPFFSQADALRGTYSIEEFVKGLLMDGICSCFAFQKSFLNASSTRR